MVRPNVTPWAIQKFGPQLLSLIETYRFPEDETIENMYILEGRNMGTQVVLRELCLLGQIWDDKAITKWFLSSLDTLKVFEYNFFNHTRNIRLNNPNQRKNKKDKTDPINWGSRNLLARFLLGHIGQQLPHLFQFLGNQLRIRHPADGTAIERWQKPRPNFQVRQDMFRATGQKNRKWTF